MTKPVPDPPLSTQTSTTFGSCNGSHDPLFAVRAGVSSEDALIHTSTLLKAPTRPTPTPVSGSMPRCAGCSGPPMRPAYPVQ
ncbi:DUF3077 domain-containing protein [Pseudomonas sp. B21-012]|uniref:DUF3077 domain-containing protein n=1 Tax=Pseudomonas sp. B21-012 TaxID=2895472 RepID=UPI0038D3C8D9